MKLLVNSLSLLLCILPLLVDAKAVGAKKHEEGLVRWNGFKVNEKRAKRRQLGNVRGERKTKDDYEEYESKSKKEKLGKKDKCNRDRRSVSVTTIFDNSAISPVESGSVTGVEFDFEGDYTGTWTQTTIEITDEILLGHDHLTFFDKDGKVVGAITTQFDGTLDFAIITAGYGEFACAQGAPTVQMTDDSSMLHVVWDLCVCYH